MAQTQPDALATATASMMDSNGQAQQQQSLWRRLFSGREKDNGASSALSDVSIKGQGAEQQDDTKAGLIRRVSRKVVPGLPRAPTFKRQQSELRSRLEPVRPTPAERRAVSMDRRMHGSNSAFTQSNPRTSAPDFLHHSLSVTPSPLSRPTSPIDGVLDSTGDLSGFALDMDLDDHGPVRDADASSKLDVQSMTTSQYDAMIDDELERIWILNLSMHFRDKSKREKFFVTYREHEHLWRRVTISLDYRCAPEPSLELDLAHTKFQRDKSAKIYDAIRESLPDIQFYDTVTNLKLETKDGRLHVHVVEDVNEIIHYPSVRMIQHMNCRRVKEREIQFDSHMSGFVYKVRVHGRQLIKKEIPGPDTVEEFLYEINALNSLQAANNVIQFYGVVVDEREELVTGLLISYAERGALIDVIYDHDHSLPWPTREKWARQIVTGLSEIHEAGFVQGDFTLSNIVIDKNEDAKIIDINRRGCPIGWEPPEATPMIESGQRISMYIGVKSDLYQLGMVLWALAMQEDEPEAFGRPLKIDSGVQVPAWYKRVVDTCLSVNPRNRLHACQLLSWFPDREEESHYGAPNGSFTSLNDDISSRHDYIPDHFPNGVPRIMTVHPPNDWAYVGWNAHSVPDDSYYYPARGRSPPSPMPSNQGDYKSLRYGPRMHTWSDTYNHALTVPSVGNKPSSNFGGHSSAQMRRSMESLGKYPDRVSIDDESLVADQPRSLPSNKPQKSRDRTQAQTSLNADKQRRSSLGSVESSVDTPVRDSGPADNSTTRKPATGPESQTDSGKDVTDLASTPREKQLAGVIPRDDREEARGQSHGGKRSIGTAEGGVTTSMGLSMPTLEPDVGVSSDNEKNDCFSGRLAQPDDLAGVGSAYGLPFPDSLTGNEKRRIDGEMILDDELGLDLDAGLSRLAVGALDNPGR